MGLENLQRLGVKAMSPCVVCERQMLQTGLPLFHRFKLKRCGIDGDAVRRHVGLAMTMGGGEAGLALASVLGPEPDPVVIMDEHPEFNVCHDCASKTSVEQLLFVMMAKGEKEK